MEAMDWLREGIHELIEMRVRETHEVARERSWTSLRCSMTPATWDQTVLCLGLPIGYRVCFSHTYVNVP